MKCKVVKTDLKINGVIIPEGTERDFSAKEIKGLEDYLIPCKIEVTPSEGEGKSSKKKGVKK